MTRVLKYPEAPSPLLKYTRGERYVRNTITRVLKHPEAHPHDFPEQRRVTIYGGGMYWW